MASEIFFFSGHISTTIPRSVHFLFRCLGLLIAQLRAQRPFAPQVKQTAKPPSLVQITPMATKGIIRMLGGKIRGRESWGCGHMANKRGSRMAWLGGGGKR